MDSRSWKKGEYAVSSVVGELLLIVISISLLSVVTVTILTPMSKYNGEIIADITAYQTEDTIVFQHIGGEELPAYSILKNQTKIGEGWNFSFSETIKIDDAEMGSYLLTSGGKVMCKIVAETWDDSASGSEEPPPDGPFPNQPDPISFPPNIYIDNDTENPQDIIDSSPDDSVINLNGTIYTTETWYVNHPLTIQNGTIFRTGNTGSALRVTSDDVIIQNINITGRGSSINGAGIFIEYAENVTIRFVNIVGMYYAGAPPDMGRFGIRNYGGNISMNWCKIWHCELGLMNDEDGTGIITNSSIRYNHGYGLEGGNSYYMEHSILRNNSGCDLHWNNEKNVIVACKIGVICAW